MMDAIKAALKWREEFGFQGRGGVIVVYQEIVQGWVNELRNPDHWQPGCVAVDEAGRSWTAFSGTAQNGALFWMSNDPIDD